MESKLRNVDINYKTYLKNNNNYICQPIDITLGSIAALENFRLYALKRFDRDLAIREAVTITGATKAVLDVTALYLTVNYVSPETGKIAGTLKFLGFTPSFIAFEVKKNFETNARKEVIAIIPQEMFLSLSGEVSQNPCLSYKKPRKCGKIKRFWKIAFHLKGENTLTGRCSLI